MSKRFSIAGLMGFVLVAAFGFAGLKSADPEWASLCFSLLAVALVVAPLNAWQGRGKVRAYWGGFAAAGWAYFAIAFGGMGPSEVTSPALATGALFERIEPLIHPVNPNFSVTLASSTFFPMPVAPMPPSIVSPPVTAGSGGVAQPAVSIAPFPTPMAPAPVAPPPPAPVAPPPPAPFIVFPTPTQSPSQRPIQQVAHSLAGLLAGMFGGLYSAWLFARRERREGQPPTDPARPADPGPLS